jgi:hypothetical protein
MRHRVILAFLQAAQNHSERRRRDVPVLWGPHRLRLAKRIQHELSAYVSRVPVTDKGNTETD